MTCIPNMYPLGAIVAIFPVRRERETGTGDEIQWLAKLGYDEGIHLSKDFSMEET
jgi:hypothetical protein